MVDNLRKNVRDYDRQRNTESQMYRTEREPTTRLLCWKCRRNKAEVKLQEHEKKCGGLWVQVRA